MKTSLGHLPPHKQAQLQAITEVLTGGAPVELLILFGSHARGEQVADPVTGYVSDYDLLAIVETEQQAEDHATWEPLVAKARALAGETPVALIAHDIRFVNHEIRVGQYFFADVVNEGILLHDSRRYHLARPKALNDGERLELAERNFRHWFGSASEFWRGCRYYAARGLLNHAAFLLHQATERYFHALLLVFTGYKPRSHDIELLATQAAAQHPLMVEALPNTEPEDQRLFKLLKKAYIDSRYSQSYRITAEELGLLQDRVRVMGERVRAACVERLASFRGAGSVAADLPEVPAVEEELVADLPEVPTDPTRFGEWRRELVELSMRAGRKEGEEKGRADGLREGKADGLKEGEAKGLREALKVFLAARGIEVPAVAMARLETTQDVAELRRWAERASVATTWEDVVRSEEPRASS